MSSSKKTETPILPELPENFKWEVTQNGGYKSYAIRITVLTKWTRRATLTGGGELVVWVSEEPGQRAMLRLWNGNSWGTPIMADSVQEAVDLGYAHFMMGNVEYEILG